MSMGAESVDRGERPALETGGISTDRVRSRLTPWLKNLVNSGEVEEPLVLILSQVTNLGGPKPVEEIDFDWSKQTVDECVDDILMAAIEDLEGGNFKTDVAYSVSVNGREGRHTFTLKPTRRTGHDNERRRDYHPDMQGLTAQLMEQNLQLTDRVIDTSSANVNVLLRTIDDQRREIQFLKKGQYQRDIQIQKLIDGELERKILVDEHEAKMEQTAKIADGIKNALPGIVATLAGPNAGAALSMVMQASGGGGGGDPGASGLLAGPDIQGGPALPPDLRLIDEFVLRLEQKPKVREELFKALAGDNEAFGLLAELYKLSTARREARAAAQEEAAAERRERNGIPLG